MPVAAAPVRNGAVLVGRSGRVAAVGAADEVPAPAGADTLHLPDSIVLPGLVNTHTHLELTCLRGLVTEKPFFNWVRRVKQIKDALTDADYRSSARWGVLESFAAGITTIGDTGSSLAPARAMASLGARGIAYHEVFGPHPAQCRESMDGLAVSLLELDALASERLMIGVSPHAPYTVSTDLLEEVIRIAFEEDRPLAMHMSESRAEWELFTEGTGAFAEMFERRGIPLPEDHESPLEWAGGMMMPELRALLIHCVHLSEDDLWFLENGPAAVAHCPWSNHALDVGAMNLEAMLDRGVRVGLGTDSVAAGRPMDMFEEMRAAARTTPSLDPGECLSLATLEAAQALGVADVGLIATGAWGDLCALSLEGGDDPIARVVRDAAARHVSHAWIAGKAVYREGQWPGVDSETERAALAVAVENAKNAKNAENA